MNRIPVKSSQIASIGHDGISKMEVEFLGWNQKPNTVYLFKNVTPEIHKELMAAPSIGKYFGQVIKPNKDKYPFEKLS